MSKKAEERRELYEAYKASGQRAGTYSREQRICYKRLQRAIRKIEGSETKPVKIPPVKFKEIIIKQKDVLNRYEIVLSNGIEVRAYSGYEIKELKELVEVLKEC